MTSSVAASESPKFALGGGSEKGRNINSAERFNQSGGFPGFEQSVDTTKPLDNDNRMGQTLSPLSHKIQQFQENSNNFNPGDLKHATVVHVKENLKPQYNDRPKTVDIRATSLNDNNDSNLLKFDNKSNSDAESVFSINSSMVGSSQKEAKSDPLSVEVYGSQRKVEKHESTGGRYNVIDETVGDVNMDMTLMSLNKTGPLGTLGQHRRLKSDMTKSDPYAAT